MAVARKRQHGIQPCSVGVRFVEQASIFCDKWHAPQRSTLAHIQILEASVQEAPEAVKVREAMKSKSLHVWAKIEQELVYILLKDARRTCVESNLYLASMGVSRQARGP